MWKNGKIKTPRKTCPSTSSRNKKRLELIMKCNSEKSTSTRLRHEAAHFFLFLWPNTPTRAKATLLVRFLDQTQLDTHTLQDSPQRVISPSQRPLPTQQTQEMFMFSVGREPVISAIQTTGQAWNGTVS